MSPRESWWEPDQYCSLNLPPSLHAAANENEVTMMFSTGQTPFFIASSMSPDGELSGCRKDESNGFLYKRPLLAESLGLVSPGIRNIN
jgi:hypothetical protein